MTGETKKEERNIWLEEDFFEVFRYVTISEEEVMQALEEGNWDEYIKLKEERERQINYWIMKKRLQKP